MAPGQSVKASDGRPVAGADRDGRHRRGGGERRAGREPVRRRPDPGGQPHDVAAPTQVNLQVRIAEVARNVDRQLGIQWNDVSVGINGGRDRLLRRRRRAEGDYRPLRRHPRQLQHRRGAAGAGGGGARHHHGRAEPHRPLGRAGASFLAGGEYPYSTVSDDGTNVQFKNFGIGLNFTPTVIDGNRISLKVATEVSELDFATSARNGARRSRPGGRRRRSTSPAARASPSPG